MTGTSILYRFVLYIQSQSWNHLSLFFDDQNTVYFSLHTMCSEICLNLKHSSIMFIELNTVSTHYYNKTFFHKLNTSCSQTKTHNIWPEAPVKHPIFFFIKILSFSFTYHSTATPFIMKFEQ